MTARSPAHAENTPAPGATVAERIKTVRAKLSPSERRIVGALMENYPTAGLGAVARFAEVAKVSAPTVLRFVNKLGFQGYGEFQESLREEVQSRLFSPVNVYPSAAPLDDEDLAKAEYRYMEGLQATMRDNDREDLAYSVDLLCDPNQRVLTFGGKYSSILASHLARYLHMLRPGVEQVEPSTVGRLSSLLDIDDGVTLVVFDYRRHQQSTVDWATGAGRRGARIILVTDPYLSPVASSAEIILTTTPSSLGPFDSLAQGLVLVEILISLCAQELGEPAKERLARFEDLQIREEKARHPVHGIPD